MISKGHLQKSCVDISRKSFRIASTGSSMWDDTDKAHLQIGWRGFCFAIQDFLQ